MPRLFWKLFLALWLSIMGFAAVSAMVNLHLARQVLQDPQLEDRDRGAHKAAHLVSMTLRRGGEPAARDAIAGLPRGMRRQVYLFDEDGREVLGRDRPRDRFDGGRLHQQRETLRAPDGGRYELVILRRPPPLSLLEPGVRGVVHRLLLAAVIAAIVSFFLARYLARPLESLGRASRQLATGDLSARVGAPLVDRRDEFGLLARDFDDMAMRLERLQAANHRLLRDVSHELRSPLARLRVALELARGRDGQPALAELDRIELEGDRLEQLVDQVLDLLRESSGAVPLERSRFDLGELLSDLVDVVGYEIPDDRRAISLDLPGELPVDANRELLWRAFENLLRNAIRHTGERGSVTVAARLDGRGGVDVIVADDGPGVPPEQLARIFDPFYRVQEARDRHSGGHGLGLAIAAAAVRRHEGQLQACNREQGGLEMGVHLPLAG
ncbi:HAMP domain-containing protein [Marinihelvus fidelis]|uniref:histidine kinase n=1 Tax=Marinihelvus fidelis TaxID=2613842 RepID=A0A5N0T453_9GAMM|nr:ATP-binding protein [Marinihelvus fidelis]KAA9129850.1 HAMP domain-containing protein [Marinihelvus fidelis]